MTEDEKWMELACQEAEKALGLTSPNPIVGAVAVKDDKVLSRGYHKKAGTPHAEVNCIQEGIGMNEINNITRSTFSIVCYQCGLVINIIYNDSDKKHSSSLLR